MKSGRKSIRTSDARSNSTIATVTQKDKFMSDRNLVAGIVYEETREVGMSAGLNVCHS